MYLWHSPIYANYVDDSLELSYNFTYIYDNMHSQSFIVYFVHYQKQKTQSLQMNLAIYCEKKCGE